MTRRGTDGRRPGRRAALAVLAIIVALGVAIPALGAQEKALTIGPPATAGEGLTDLSGLTYEEAESRLTQLDEITLPLGIDGLQSVQVSSVTLDSDDATRSLSLSGDATLPATGDVDLLLTAVWDADDSTDPAVAIAAKADDLSLTALNPLWDDTYGDATFSTARVAFANRDHTLDPAELPEAAADFYSEPVDLTGGVSFAGDLELEGRLAEAFGYAGYSGEVGLEGSLAGSAAALFGGATDEQLGALELTATLGKADDAPDWISARSTSFTFALEEGAPRLSVAEDVTLEVDGTQNRFTGSLDVAPSGAIAAEIALVGELDAPFGLDGLDPSRLSDIALRLSRDEGVTEGGLQLGVEIEEGEDPVTILASFSTGGGATTVDFSVEGSIGVPALVALGGDLLGTEVAEVPGAEDVSLDGVSFSFTTGADERIFSVGAQATIKSLEAAVVLTLRKSGAEPAQPLLGLRVSDPGCDGDCVRMSSLLPAEDAGELLSGLELPALNLTVAPPTLTELAAEDLTAQEQAFFGEAYETLPDTLAFEAGLSMQGRLPVEALGDDLQTALGYPAGSEVLLAGSLGVGLDAVRGGGRLALTGLELEAVLPAGTPTVLPDWVQVTSPTTLGFRYAAGEVGVSFDTGATVTVDGTAFATTISGAYERAQGRSSIAFRGTITDWQQPFGVEWIDSIDSATVAIDSSFGAGRPATVEASATAATELGGKAFELEFALSKAVSTTASLTARFADTASLSEIVGLFPELEQAAGDVGANDALDSLSIGPVSVSATVGGAASTFELAARTTFTTGADTAVASDLLVAARPGGGGFTLGLKARGKLALDELVADAPSVDVDLPGAALVLGDTTASRPVAQLTDGEWDFYKTLYGCEEDDERGDCTAFTKLDTTPGLKLLAAFDLGEDVESMASEIGIQTSGSGLLTGTVPVLGGTEFAVSASLGNFRFAQAPDWYDRGDVALEIGTNGLKFAGRLGMKIQREGAEWMENCEESGGVVRYPFGTLEGRCYDLLTFEVSARVALQPAPSLTLTGKLEADTAWKNAFGEEWLEIRRVAVQLGVTLPPTGPELTLGFQGDIKVGSKDLAAALKIGLAPLPGPPFVRPNLIGFSAASKAGLALSDIVWLNNQITGDALQIDTTTMPDVSMRNLFFQYSQQTDVDLCLTAGVRFNADLYVGTNLPGADGEDDPGGCRTIDTNPDTRASCSDRSDEGCLASVYGRFDSGGLEAGGDLAAFELGPIQMEDSLVQLSLTPTRQRLRMKGGARVGTSSYEFAKGKADLDFSRDGFDFKGDAAMFDDAFHGYLELAAPFDLSNPSFKVKAWLRADARSAMNGLVGEKAEKVRPVIVGFGQLLQALTGDGSVANIRDLPSLLEKAGAPVPSEVRTMTTALGDAQAEIQRYAGPVLTLQPLLKGVSFNVPGVPGFYTPRTCITTEKNGQCWTTPPFDTLFGTVPGIPGTWVPSTCVVTEIDGACWTTPPFGVSVPGICSRLGISNSSPDCSWNGLMRRFVEPALIEALEEATGLDFGVADFESAITTLVDRFADGAGSIVNVDCAYFSADATALAQGNVDVDLATKLRLFDYPLEFGTSWDFRVKSGSPDEVLASIFKSLFSPSATTCPALPAGHEEPGEEVASRKLVAALAPATSTEGGEVSLSATFEGAGSSFPAVQVNWGDGSSSTIPAGSAETVTARHTYADDGASGTPEATYPVSVTVQDAGAHTVALQAVVRNAAPVLTSLTAEPAPADEHGVVTLRGALTDAGVPDTHAVRVDWGDGSEPEQLALAGGARSFTAQHRYLDDPEDGETYRVTAVLTDDDTGSATRTLDAQVRNVSPSQIRVTPVEVLEAEGGAPDELEEVTEGAIVAYEIAFADPGTLDEHELTIDWGDGGEPQVAQLGAGARTLTLPHRFLDDGTFDVEVRVTDGDGGEGEGTSPIEVVNVAPAVDVALDRASIDEGEAATLGGSISDPGVLDSHTVTIDWGAGRTAADRYQTVPVAAEDRTFEATKPYGDDGAFTVAVAVEDDDGGTGAASTPLAVANHAPETAISGAGSIAAPGGRTLIARAGTPLELRARLRDVGSDDLTSTWTWQDATADTATAFLAAPPALDPDPSPQVGPRDETDVVRHTWARACLYEDVRAALADDDAGGAADRIDVVVTGTASRSEGVGAWQREYDPRKAPVLPLDALGCYLAITGQMSAVFGEARPLGTRAAAYDVLNPGSGPNAERDKLDRDLLSAWLDFANGARPYAAIQSVLREAEATRLRPGATDDDFRRARLAVAAL